MLQKLSKPQETVCLVGKAGIRGNALGDPGARVWAEGADTPRMLSVGLHLRMIGRPGGISGLERGLRRMRDRGGVWLARP